MQRTDVIVAGGGLAGTLLARFLILEGYSVTLFSDDQRSASHIAAGILHPVTGRRLVKSWMADTFIPFAADTYAAIEKETGASFYREMNITELLRDASEYNRWTEAASDESLHNYIKAPDTVSLPGIQPFPYSATIHGAVLQTNTFLEAIHTWLRSKCNVVNSTVDAGEITLHENGIRYNDVHAAQLIFCEGYKSQSNPFWKNLPWLPSKGEMLTIRCPGLMAESILNRNVFILPLGNDLFRVGSTYAWDSLNDVPTEEARDKLATDVAKIINRPFEITKQDAAIRPTVKERRPFLGFHPVHSHVGIFNGLGTKGAMSAPWLAHHLVRHIRYKEPLHAETDVSRYSNQLVSA